MTQGSSPVSLLVSAFGWIFAVVAVALALFVAKPYYANVGYEQGRQAQKEANIKAVDAILADRKIEGERYVVLGRLIAKQQDSLVIEVQNSALVNPLRSEPRKQTILINEDTVFEKRTMLPLDQFTKALEEARKKGLTTQDAVLHKSEPLTLEQLEIGADIRVYPKVAQDAVKDRFEAAQIMLVISNQTPSTNN